MIRLTWWGTPYVGPEPKGFKFDQPTFGHYVARFVDRLLGVNGIDVWKDR